jgi:hypothetical protein
LGLSDSEIREETGISPHQQVNQICHQLEAMGLIERRRQPAGPILNIALEEPRATTLGLMAAATSAPSRRGTAVLKRRPPHSVSSALGPSEKDKHSSSCAARQPRNEGMSDTTARPSSSTCPPKSQPT